MAQKPPARGKKGDPLIGAVVERRWRIIDQIGSGGMGAVYRAERIHLGKQVALKFLHASQLDSKSTVARFEREAKAVSRLHHVNCVSILDFGVYRKQPYIVMEYVEGRQLTELDPDTLTPSKGVSIMRQMLMGLAHAHGRGVIHRDLKLSNVMLVEMTGTEELVKLLDFGLARLVGGGVDVEKSLTHEGFVAGTPTYMSPEQCLGKTVDQRSDLYSAGVVLYTLCTGKRPFQAEDTAVLLHKQIHEAPVPPRRIAPQKRISEPLERVILRAMEKRPDDRFQTALDFLHALDSTPEGQATQTPTVAKIRAPRSRRRLLLFGALVCVVLGGAGALWIRQYYIKLEQKVGPMFQHWTHAPDAGAKRISQAPPQPQLPAPPAPKHVSVDAAVMKAPPPPPDAAVTIHEVKEPEPLTEPVKAVKAAPPPPRPTAVFDTAYRPRVDQLMKGDDIAAATNLLRDHLGDPWARLRLGNIYAFRHFRENAFKEWDKAFNQDASLKSDKGFRRMFCDAVDFEQREVVESFLTTHFPSEMSALLMSCLQRTSADKLCQEKKAAAEILTKLHYTQARPALEKLERARQEHKQQHPPPAQFACYGESLPKLIDQLK